MAMEIIFSNRKYIYIYSTNGGFFIATLVHRKVPKRPPKNAATSSDFSSTGPLGAGGGAANGAASLDNGQRGTVEAINKSKSNGSGPVRLQHGSKVPKETNIKDMFKRLLVLLVYRQFHELLTNCS